MTEQLAGYVLEERLAVGGMAEVFRAQRVGASGFKKQVAIKRLLPDLAKDPRFVEMFESEARLAAQIDSDNIVQVFDFGEENGFHFLVMEYVDGCDLAAVLANSVLPPNLAAHVAQQMCVALDDLFKATDDLGQPLIIAHRDVTPGNVFISRRGAIKLGDLGIAKARVRSMRTEAGHLKGKLAYMSPEQARGDDVDIRTDIYCVGVTLYEALTGERYLSATTDAMLVDLARAPEKCLAKISGNVSSRHLAEVLERCLQPEPSGRFATPAAVLEALESAVDISDVASLRQQLATMVGLLALPAPEVDFVDAAAVPRRHPTQPNNEPSVKTEVYDPLATSPLGRVRPTLWVGLLIAAVTYLLWSFEPFGVRRQSPSAIKQRETISQPAIEPLTTTTKTGPQRPLPPPTSRVTGRQSLASTSVSKRPVLTAPSEMSPSPDLLPPPPGSTVAVAQVPTDAATGVEGQLHQAAAILERRGILESDAPRIFAEHLRLSQRPHSGTEELRQAKGLVEQVSSLVVDRAFIDTKLQRINREMVGHDLDAETKAKVRRSIREVLSLAVTAQYDSANHELNRVLSLIGGSASSLSGDRDDNSVQRSPR